MLKNYVKIAIAVLRRKKFFTFISLFGISFTLTILMVTTAFIDKLVNDKYPDINRERSLYVNKVEQIGKEARVSSAMSFYFLDHFVRTLKTPLKVAISSNFKTASSYVNNRKITINYKYTNQDYWEILDYKFIEGKALSSQQILNGEYVAVISDDIKKQYFGDVGTVIGKYIVVDNEKYRICGVVKGVPASTYQMYADVYIPYTLSKNDYNNKSYMGEYTGILLAAQKSDIPKMRQEYADMVSKLPMESKEYEVIKTSADTYIKSYVNTGNSQQSGIALVIVGLSGFVLFITVLPIINLININLTRIMERSSEIGVRKAFGASSNVLVYQFVIENLILTLLGGLIGVIFSAVVIVIINNVNTISNLNLALNFTVLFYAFVICLIFGILSGVYPAWRMSKLNVVTALKGQ